ncbi:MAG: Fic family protein [bacterium]
MAVYEKWSHIKFQKTWQIGESVSFMLGQCEAMLDIICREPLLPEYRKDWYKVALIKGAKATTAIEGNTLSEEEIAKINEGAHLPKSMEYLEIEVKNIIEALNDIRDEVILKKADSLITPELILSFHQYVGKNLGEKFDAAPGHFRKSGHEVVVGRYRAPDGSLVREMMIKLCNWLQSEFEYSNRSQNFMGSIIEAIVVHIYIAWIHPFGDGNGRTARLVEFFLLLRAGVPDIASHTLSNFYNKTRSEYYRQIEQSISAGDISEFINYAVEGFRDELKTLVDGVIESQIKAFWRIHIYETLDSKKSSGKTKNIVKRRREFMLNIPIGKQLSIEQLMTDVPVIFMIYRNMSPATIRRDIKDLLALELIVKENDKYKANTDVLIKALPLKKR